MPTSSDPTSPGPSVTAIALRSSNSRRRFLQRHPHRRDNRPQVLARRQLRHHASILRMRRHLRGNHGRQDPRAVFDHGRGRFIARRFNPQNPHLVSCARHASPCFQFTVGHVRASFRFRLPPPRRSHRPGASARPRRVADARGRSHHRQVGRSRSSAISRRTSNPTTASSSTIPAFCPPASTAIASMAREKSKSS